MNSSVLSYVLHLLLSCRNLDEVRVRHAEELEELDEAGSEVDLRPLVFRSSPVTRVLVVPVVPPFADRDDRDEKILCRKNAAVVRTSAEHVTDAVYTPSCVKHENVSKT